MILPLLLPLIALAAHPFDNLARELSAREDLADFSREVQLDVRYATPNNFMARNVYGPFRACFVHAEVAPKLRAALAELRRVRPGWRLRAFDCLRPVRAQEQLWEAVRGTPNEIYVVNPRIGSLHSYGFALDVSLSDAQGREVDMGAPFDFFGPRGEPRHEQELLQQGQLTAQQVANRELLRRVMRAGGFRTISTEWWHFDALDGATVRGNYAPIP